jgi:hypothetical protein
VSAQVDFKPRAHAFLHAAEKTELPVSFSEGPLGMLQWAWVGVLGGLVVGCGLFVFAAVGQHGKRHY